MLEFYLDTDNLQEIIRFSNCLPLRGITTNPTILSRSRQGLSKVLHKVSDVLGPNTRFHVQVTTASISEMTDEALSLADLPFDIVVKIPASESGLAAIKQIKDRKIPVLATAVFSSHQGFLAALCGADYVAPYINRIDALGGDGIGTTKDLKLLIDSHNLDCKLLPASFKNSRQVVETLKLGVPSITVAPEIMDQMINNATVESTIDQFNQDWVGAFSNKLSFET